MAWVNPTDGPQHGPDAEGLRRTFDDLSRSLDANNTAIAAAYAAADAVVQATVAVQLISAQLLGSDTATVTFSSIPATFQALRLVWQAKCSNAAVQDLRVRFNSDTGTNYRRESSYGVGGTPSAFGDNAATFISGGLLTTSAADGQPGAGEFVIPNYRVGSTFNRSLSGTWFGYDSVADLPNGGTVGGSWFSTAAITTIALSSSAGNLKTASNFSLYGLK